MRVRVTVVAHGYGQTGEIVARRRDRGLLITSCDSFTSLEMENFKLRTEYSSTDERVTTVNCISSTESNKAPDNCIG